MNLIKNIFLEGEIPTLRIRNHTFMTSTRKGGGVGGLEIRPVFADSIVFKQ